MKLARLILLGALVLPSLEASAAISTFEFVEKENEQDYAGGGRYWSGLDPEAGGSIASSFTSGDATFFNVNNKTDGGATYWNGFAYSNTSDTTSSELENQYSAFPGMGANGSANYAVSYNHGARIEFSAPTTLSSVMITNTTFTVMTYLNGNMFAKKFGGASGDDEDFFKLVISGEDGLGNEISNLSFYLADYRDPDNENDYFVDEWETVDLLSLGSVNALSFSYESSDLSFGYINTPLYFALDNLTPVPLPAGVYLFASAFGLLFASKRARRDSKLKNKVITLLSTMSLQAKMRR